MHSITIEHLKLKLKMKDKDNAFVLQGAVGLDGPKGDQVGFKNQTFFSNQKWGKVI